MANIVSSPAFVLLQVLKSPLRGQLALPGSKSLTNRALLLAALAKGQSHLSGALKSDDTIKMAQALSDCGVTINEPSDTEFIVNSIGKLNPPNKEIFLGNSGTSVRFLTAACAAMNGHFIVTGDENMQKRPIAPLVDALLDAGVKIETKTNCPPVEIWGEGEFKSKEIEINASLSSQYVSALLMACAIGKNPKTINIKGGDIGARGYIDLTLECMKSFGAKLEVKNPNSFLVQPCEYQAIDYSIEPDASAATYIWGIEKLTNSNIDIGINPNSMTQPDAKAFEIINQFPNLPAIIDGSQMQDAIPTLAVLAAFNNNPVCFIRIENLRVKECDRIMAVRTGLNLISDGIAEEIDDDLLITPNRGILGKTIDVTIPTFHDHRIAMSFAMAALVISGIKIENPKCVEKTYPNFWRDLQSLGVKMNFG